VNQMLGVLSDEKHLDIKINLKESTDEEIEQQVRIICEKVINEKITETTVLVGGVTNALYKCDFEKRKSVLVRINGEGTEKIIDRKKEIAKMRQVTLKLNTGIIRGAFENGLVYDYIAGVPLGADKVPQHIDGIAQAMATFHKMDIQTESKEPMLFSTMDAWLNEIKDIEFEDDVRKRLLKTIDVQGVIKPLIAELRKRMMTKEFKVTFCHNDLLGANIIYNEDNNTYNFIDHEYGDYNYVAFDIGDHFVEWCGMEDFVPANYPSAQHQRAFVKSYLTAYDGQEPSSDAIDLLVAQSNVGSVAANVFWCVWAIFQSANSKIKFNYMEYAKSRADMCVYAKQHLEALDKINNL